MRIDQDQKANAQILSRAGGGWMVEQSVMKPDQLAEDIAELMDEPDRLITAAAAARSVGRPDAVERLADLVEKIATEKTSANKKAVPA